MAKKDIQSMKKNTGMVRDQLRKSIMVMSQNEHLGVLYFPEEMVPEGKVWAWATERVHGQYNDEGMQKLVASGWTPVNGKDIPFFMTELFHNEDEDFHYVRKGVCLLIENDKDVIDLLENKMKKDSENRLENSTKPKNYNYNNVSVYENDTNNAIY
jgi:hypothetical protein